MPLQSLHSTSSLSLERLYPAFYRQAGIRLITQLKEPPLSSLQDFEFPKASVVHYFDNEELLLGPEPQDPLFKKYPSRILVQHIQELHEPIGKPRLNRGNPPAVLFREYHQRYRSMRRMHDYNKSMRQEMTLLVVNYCHLSSLFLYMRSVFGNYYKWYNAYKTYFYQINEKMKGNERQHFIMARVPDRLPGRKTLRKLSADYTKIPRKLLSVLSKPDYFLLVEMWKWFGEDRRSSLMGQIDSAHYRRLNIVWVEGAEYFVMNLGQLLSIDPSVDAPEDAADDEGASRLQRRILLLWKQLYDRRQSMSGNVVTPASSDKDTEADVVDDVESTPRRVSITTPRPQAERIPITPPESVVDTSADDDEEEGVTQIKVGTTTVDVKATDDDVLSEDDEDDELDQLDKLSEQIESDDTDSDVLSQVNLEDLIVPENPTDALLEQINERLDNGEITPAQHKRFLAMVGKFKELKAPGTDIPLEAFAQIDPETLEIIEEETNIPVSGGVIDESMNQSSVQVFDSKYIETTMDKDIAGVVCSLQRAGIFVTDFRSEEIEDVSNHYRIYTLRITPLDGQPSTIRFRLPVIQPDGTFIANGIRYRLKSQRSDLPIRKTKPHEVALTSYYAKVFIERSQKSVVNYPKWLINQIRLIGDDPEDTRITNMKLIETFDHEVLMPRIYTILASSFREFTIQNKYIIYVDYFHRGEVIGDDVIQANEFEGYTVIGYTKGKNRHPILIDENDTFYIRDGKDLTVLGTIEELLDLDASKAPVEIAEFRLFSKNMPVGVILGHHFGLSKLISILQVRMRRVPQGTRLNLQSNEYAVRFADETLVFDRENKKAQLILAGLNRYHREIERYNVDLFDQQDVWENVMEDNGIRIGTIRELRFAMEMFVDPITYEILKDMDEPTSLDLLIIRACELLLTDWHPKENDIHHQRVRGYERMVGTVYTETMRSIRRHRSRGMGAQNKIEQNPEAVWQNVVNGDASVSQVEELNPIENLKEKELITYSGTGGRSGQTIVKRIRAFHENDIGVISEATTDSGTVGVNTYSSYNPQIRNLRGITKLPTEDTYNNPSSLLSTSALLAPAADMDDGKRINFISIQNKHVVATEGAHAMPLRTGMEAALSHRVDDVYAYTAKQNGKVTEVTSTHIAIEYKDGSVVRIELGRRYGTVTGTTIPHEVITHFKVGDTFKVGQAIAYNAGFFEGDPLSPGEVLYKGGVLAKVAILERAHTYEDASVISKGLATKLTTGLSHIRTVVVGFKDVIRNLVNVGSTVDIETILCTIEDEVAAKSDLFDDDSIDTLNLLSSNAPKAKHEGVIERIEILYHGDIEDMSESLQTLAKASDRARSIRLRRLGKKPVTGQIDGTTRVGKNAIDFESLVIQFYITEKLDFGIGDKVTFGNQLKSIVSYVMEDGNTTESGVEIDALFSYLGIKNRIVLSPEIMGTTNTLLKIMSQRVAATYFKEKG